MPHAKRLTWVNWLARFFAFVQIPDDSLMLIPIYKIKNGKVELSLSGMKKK